MPTYEHSNLNKEKPVGGSADKILALFNNEAGNDIISRSNKIVISLKTQESFETSLRSMPNSIYSLAAGSSLSNIFIPFEASIYSSGVSGLPSVHKSASGLFPSGTIPSIKDLMPFKWNPSESGIIFDRHQAVSGDGLGGLLSGKEYIGDSERFRDGGIVRGIGLRLPLMGVGWGYDLDGNPWPSGINAHDPSGSYFDGGYKNGWQVDPSKYIAAPIDFRYDKDRHVWATTSDSSFYAIIAGTSGTYSGASGAGSLLRTSHSWREVEPTNSGIMSTKPNGKQGTFFKNPGYEINGLRVAINTIVRMEKRGNDNNSYIFRMTIPKSTGRYQVLSLTDDINTVGFDFPRFS